MPEVSEKSGPSISKSALLLSPCLFWAKNGTEWYDEAYTDTTDRDFGTLFHQKIDDYLKGKDG